MFNMRAVAVLVALLLISLASAAAYAETPPEFEDISTIQVDEDSPVAIDLAAPRWDEETSGPMVDEDAMGPDDEADFGIAGIGNQPVVVLGRPSGRQPDPKARSLENGKDPARQPATVDARAQARADGTVFQGGPARIVQAATVQTGNEEPRASQAAVVEPAAATVYAAGADGISCPNPSGNCTDGTPATYFATGSTMGYRAYVANYTGSTQTIRLRYRVKTPCSTYDAYNNNSYSVAANTPGYVWYISYGPVTALCPGRHTLTVSVTYGGRTTSKSDSFTVTGTGTVEAVYAETTDENIDSADSFVAGEDVIVWWGELLNTTNRTKTANLRFLLQTPCDVDGSYLRSGNVSVQWGYRWFYYVDYATCPGTHTLTVYTTYNGSTTYDSFQYTVTGSGTVWSEDTWTADGNGVAKRIFNAGDPIRWYGMPLNSTAAVQTIDDTLTLETPCGTDDLWDDTDDVDPGYTRWYYSGKAACPGVHELTFSVTYDGEITTSTYTYTVRGSGSVTANNADASDTNGDAQTSFNADDTIRYYGQVFNSTNSAKTVTLAWSLRTPCGTRTLWRGNVEIDPGYDWIYTPATAYCPGTHTIKFSVTYRGRATSKTYNYTVTGDGSIVGRNTWVADSRGRAKTSVRAGDPIRYYGQAFNSGPTQPFTGTFTLDSPCGSDQTLWSGTLNATKGVTTTYYISRVAACPGAHTLTFSATYSGTTTTATRAYTVTGTGSVTAFSVMTADASGNAATSFHAGDSVRLYGTAFNSTAASQTITWRWSTRCGSWSYSNTGLSADTGYTSGYQTITATCLGRNTFTFSVTYNGKTTSKSVNFTVRAATLPRSEEAETGRGISPPV